MPGDDVRARVTRSNHTIHNPDDARHFMRVKPAGRHVRIRHGDRLVAETLGALRVLEAGKDLHDPVLYLPRADVVAKLRPAAKARTFCPLKGYASYYDLLDENGGVAIAEAAWCYEETLDLAAELSGRIAFYGSKVTIVEAPLPA